MKSFWYLYCYLWTYFTLVFLLLTLNSYMFAGVSTAWKMSKYGVSSGPYFSAFGLNTSISPFFTQCSLQNIFELLLLHYLDIWRNSIWPCRWFASIVSHFSLKGSLNGYISLRTKVGGEIRCLIGGLVEYRWTSSSHLK